MSIQFLSRRAFSAASLAGAGAFALSSPTRAQDAKRGGTLTVAADSEPRNLNPAIVASNGVFFVASKVIEPLAEMAAGGDGLSPRLALSWEGAADGLSVTFQLRPGVTESPSPPPMSPSRPCRCGSRCRISGASSSKTCSRWRRRTP